MFDVFIVGGGAAGLATAVMLKQSSKDLKVAVAEQLDRVGKKISVTGNGRCNISNIKLEDKNYYSSNKDLALKIINNFNLNSTKKFFRDLGVEFVYEENKIFPRSYQASSVVDALRFKAENLGVTLLLNATVTQIQKINNTFEIDCIKMKHYSKNVVIASGGLAGGSKLGSNGDGYKILKKFGHKILPQTPVIVQIKTENVVTKSLKGIKVNALVCVKKGNKDLAQQYGEVLFCDYGLSGPPVLQLSRHCLSGTKLTLDLFNDIDINSLTNLLIKRKEIFKSQPLTEFFAGLLHKRVGQAVIKLCDISLSNTAETLSDSDCKNIANTLKNLSFKVVGNTGFVNAQATSGGADLLDFDENLMSKKCKGLYAAGEVLDVDGDCGGYNLQWAWSSAAAVSKGILV